MTAIEEKTKKDIVDHLYWDSRVDAAHVMVDVTNGIATLTGSVPDYQSRQAAEQDAWIVDGVFSVDNQLTVEFSEQSEIPEDVEIATNIRNFFTWDANLDATRLEVSVSQGFVILEGSVDKYWKKGLAEDIAARMTGVAYVKNMITVVPTHDIEDESIAERVMAAIDRSSGVNGEALDVKVENGVVTLSGSVPNRSAERAAYNAVIHTDGVVDFRNHLIIENY